MASGVTSLRLEPTLTTENSLNPLQTNSSRAQTSRESQQAAENLRHYPISEVSTVTTNSIVPDESAGNHYPMANINDQPLPISYDLNSPENNLNHYPLASANLDTTPLATVNEKVQFRRRLVQFYPVKFVLFVALGIILFNMIILYFEASTNQLRYFAYNIYFVSKYAVITSLTNNLYAILAIITSIMRYNSIFVKVLID